MKKIYIILITLLIVNISKAQYVTIPDPNFAAYLNTVIPSAMIGNQMDTTNAEINQLHSLYCSAMGIADLTGMQYLHALGYIEVGNEYNSLNPNMLTSIPELPNSLYYLGCDYNLLTNLPVLPNTLTNLECSFNQLTTLPSLPTVIQTLWCNFNQLTTLPVLPNGIRKISCMENQLTTLPVLPESITMLLCDGNNLTTVPALPNNLEWFACSRNQLTNLPVLPNTLIYLSCSSNQLTNISTLPSSLISFLCDYNNINYLPALPSSLEQFWCFGNQLNCLPLLSDSIIEIKIFDNPFTCLPNYIAAMDSATLSYPLCLVGDTINNVYNCFQEGSISGNIYKDLNNNCFYDSTDLGIKNISILLFDKNNNLINHTFSVVHGLYGFSNQVDTFTVQVDTINLPIIIHCQYPGIDSTILLTSTNPFITDVNFSLTCKPGFDIGVKSVVTTGLIFPGQQHIIKILAGDMSQWFNLSCSGGISGQVIVTVNGPVSYSGVAPGALTPLVSGNIFTYNIADFGSLNILTSFGLTFLTDTSAQAGDTICVNVTVTPTTGDNYITNNTFQFCYIVLNSYDPNNKEVYPVNVLPGFNDYFTYTIHFQNTGNAPAINIRLVDTLSNNLDLSTFQITNYSHYNITSIKNNILTVSFPNIQLPDSFSNALESMGYIQYRIKPKSNLVLGTKIKNTANIYFDFNWPIRTNTTVNEFTQTGSIAKNGVALSCSLFPNPASSYFDIKLENNNDLKTIKIYTAEGVFVKQEQFTGNQTRVLTNNLSGGLYIVKIETKQGSQFKKVIVVK